VKHTLLNELATDVGTLRVQARRAFLRLGRRPETLAHFFAHAGLYVT
jgi:hypothetical protein